MSKRKFTVYIVTTTVIVLALSEPEITNVILEALELFE